MKSCTVKIRSVTPYSQSKSIEGLPKIDKEKPEERDRRLWREKSTYNAEGIVCIPGMAFKMAIDEAVKRLNIGIAGRGKSTYTKFFVAGQIPLGEQFETGIHKDDLECQEIWANADGIRGSGKRVIRRFPLIRSWEAEAQFAILDDIIPSEIFEKALIEAGRLVGIGRFRPEKGGMYGRFAPENFRWTSS